MPTIAEFKAKYGYQAAGLRLLVDELINRAKFSPETVSQSLVDEINDGMQMLQLALGEHK